MRTRTLLVLAACLATTAVMARDQPRRLVTVAADKAWLDSNECSVRDNVIVPEVGILSDQCALEQNLKERLRNGSIDFGPAPDRKI